MKVDSSHFNFDASHREVRAEERQRCIERSLVVLGVTRKQLFAEIRRYLINCINDDVLSTNEVELNRCLRYEPNQTDLWIGKRYDAAKNFDRSKSAPHIIRKDGAWFDFAFRLAESREGVEVLGYNAEIRFDCSANDPQAHWIRFDLNPRDHANEVERHMRSHMHAGSDDWLMPSPMYTPFQLLDLLVFGLVAPPDRKPRTIDVTREGRDV